jgi:hypothetical protein
MSDRQWTLFRQIIAAAWARDQKLLSILLIRFGMEAGDGK